ncbi:MAG: PHP domain-containing protein, partial [Spirochaetales bacterium]
MLVPLIVRSSYSLQRGVVQPSEWAAAAKAAGLTRLALTDRNGLYGVPTFMEACGKAGLSPLCGLELVYAGGRCVFIPRKKPGFSLLTRLLTERSADPKGFDARTAVAKALGGNNHGELFILTDDEVILAAIPPQEALFALATPCNKTKWRRLAASGHQALASPELSFLERDQREIQRLLLAIGGNCAIHDIGDGQLDLPEALWGSATLGVAPVSQAVSPWAAAPAFAPWLEKAFEANGFVAGEALDEPFSGFVFPRFAMCDSVDRGAGAVSGSRSSSSALLRTLVIEGAARRYPLVTDEVRKRIDYELDLIESKGFSDYFLVVRDIARRASRICGRGSAAASIVAYCLGITEVDPIRHSLYFERFLNPGRKDPPDIDVDFAWDERDALFDEVIEAYGPEHAARVANHNCFRSRSALRETARAFGMPDAEISAFERSLKVDSDGTLSSADPAWKTVAERASSIVGLPRHLGTHSGGLIIVPDLLADHAPIETTGSGIRVIAWDKEGAELAGLVKIDLLGNRSLAVVRDAIADIRGSGRSFDTDTWRPIDDPDTIALLSRGDTMGVFYVESPA